jgi:hypothetical protein
MAPFFMLLPARLDEIVAASAFQCHKTVDYEQLADSAPQQGKKPQQCAGLMAVLHAEGAPNQIMQVAQRLAGFDAGKIETEDTFGSLAEVYAAHGG